MTYVFSIWAVETHKTKMAGTSRNQELEAAAHWMLLYGMLVTLSLWNYLYTEDLDLYFIGASVQCTAMCAWHSFAGMFVLHQIWSKGFQIVYHLIAHVMLLLLYIVFVSINAVL